MKPTVRSLASLPALALLIGMASLPSGCDSTKGSDSQTNWLSPCDANAPCDTGLECLCGVCTVACTSGCAGLGSGAKCVKLGAAAASACVPPMPAAGLCSAPCKAHADCASHGAGLRCIEGACLGPSAPTRDGGSPPDAASGAGGVSGAGGAGAGAGSGGAAPSDAGKPGVGTDVPLMVSLGSFSTRGATDVSNAMVIAFLPPRCTWRTFATCQVFDCRVQRGDGGVSTLTGASAGTVTLHGGSNSDVVLSPRASGTYPLFTTSVPGAQTVARWQTGDTLTITAAGDVVPAFSATLSFLDPLVLTSPDLNGTAEVTVDHTTGLPLTWPPTTDTVTAGAMYLTGNTDDFDQIQGYCDFPGADGSGTLPAELFRDFLVGPQPAGLGPGASGPPGAPGPPGGGSHIQLYAGHSQVKATTAGAHAIRMITIHATQGFGQLR